MQASNYLQTAMSIELPVSILIHVADKERGNEKEQLHISVIICCLKTASSETA